MAYPQKPKPAAKRVTATRARLGGEDVNDTTEGYSTQLGIVPAVIAAAVPSVKQLAERALASVVGIFDPGKRRDANRKSRAELWGNLATLGSITAARRVYGGMTLQFTDKERGYYRDQWTRLTSAQPTLAAQAKTLGGLGIPEPGSDQEPARLSDEDSSSLQNEIDAFRSGGPSPIPVPKTAATAASAQAGSGSFFGIGIALALLAKLLGKRR